MANISLAHKEKLADMFRSGIRELAARHGISVGDMDEQLVRLLLTKPRAIGLWKKTDTIPDNIDDDHLLGFVWLMISQTGKDLGWLMEFVKLTGLIFYEPPSRNLIRAYLQKVRLEGNALLNEDIEAFLNASFEASRIMQVSREWATAIPVEAVYLVDSQDESAYLLYFDEEVQLNEYFVYFDGRYAEPDVLKLEGFDFQRRQWKFTISEVWIAHHENWENTALWKIDFNC